MPLAQRDRSQRIKKTRRSDQGASNLRAFNSQISYMDDSERGGRAVATARRRKLRVTTPLASTAIIHSITSFLT